METKDKLVTLEVLKEGLTKAVSSLTETWYGDIKDIPYDQNGMWILREYTDGPEVVIDGEVLNPSVAILFKVENHYAYLGTGNDNTTGFFIGLGDPMGSIEWDDVSDSGSDIEFPISVENGGTGAINAKDALKNLAKSGVLFSTNESIEMTSDESWVRITGKDITLTSSPDNSAISMKRGYLTVDSKERIHLRSEMLKIESKSIILDPDSVVYDFNLEPSAHITEDDIDSMFSGTYEPTGTKFATDESVKYLIDKAKEL